MSRVPLVEELMFKRDWIFDPPNELVSKFDASELARLAVIQLKAQQAVVAAQSQALDAALEIYSRHAK